MSNLLDDIINKADIVDIIGRFVKLQKKGANYFGVCPFHPDTNPSMSVSNSKKIFKCFSCGASGNVITFLQKYKKIPYAEAIKQAALLSGFNNDDINYYFSRQNKNFNEKSWKMFTLNSDANEIFQMLLFNPSNKKYLNYLLDRKLSIETIKSFQLGFCGKDDEEKILYDLLTTTHSNKDKWNEDDLLKDSLININEKTGNITDFFFKRITFPIRSKDGYIVGFIGRVLENRDPKYLTSKENQIFSKSNVLYNFDKVIIDGSETLIILEGNIDLLSLYEAGMDSQAFGAVALMGTALTAQHINSIKQNKHIKNVVLWFDKDQAGEKSCLSNGIKLIQQQLDVYVANNNTECKDVNEILSKHGKQKILDVISDVNKDDFVSYYIKKQLTNVKGNELITAVEDVLTFVARHGKTLLWSKYCQLIHNLSNIPLNDIQQTYTRLSINKFTIKQNYGFAQTTEHKKVVDLCTTREFQKHNDNLHRSLNDVIYAIASKPQIALEMYKKILYRNELQRFAQSEFNLIKALVNVEQEKDKTPVERMKEVELLLSSLLSEQKISTKVSEDLKRNFTTFVQLKEINNFSITMSESKLLGLIDHVSRETLELMRILKQQERNKDNLTDKQKEDIDLAISNMSAEIKRLLKNKIKRN